MTAEPVSPEARALLADLKTSILMIGERQESNQAIAADRAKRVDSRLAAIEVQTSATNGSVRALQLWQARVQGVGDAALPFRTAGLAALAAIGSGVATHFIF